MSLYIPPDIAHLIQSYLDTDNYVSSRSVNSSFYGEMDQGRIYPYGTEEIPTWVRKVKICANFDSFRDNDYTQLTYIDFGDDRWIPRDFLTKFINLEESHIGGKCVVQTWMSRKNTKLKKLYLHKDVKTTGFCLYKLPQLTHLKLSHRCIEFDNMKHLVNLEWLDFGDCNICGSVLKHFTKLKYLDTRNNSNVHLNDLTHLPLEFIALSLHAQEAGVDSEKIHIPTLKILQVKKPGDIFITGHQDMKIIIV